MVPIEGTESEGMWYYNPLAFSGIVNVTYPLLRLISCNVTLVNFTILLCIFILYINTHIVMNTY
jgi:hypothetical protein